MYEQKSSKKSWWQSGLRLFLRLNAWIVGPIIIAIIFGKYLDKKFNSEPWLFFATVAITFIFSFVMIIRIGLREMTASEKAEKSITKKQETKKY